MWRRRAAVLVFCSFGALPLACSSKPEAKHASAGEQDGVQAPRAVKSLSMQHRTPDAAAAASPVLVTMQAELTRSARELGARAKPPPYYIAYEVIEEQQFGVEASLGAVVTSGRDGYRSLDVDLRVGTRELDNTHPLRQEWDSGRYYTQSAWMPQENDASALEALIWITTHQEYERAVEDLVRVKASRDIKVAEEDSSADFSVEKAARYHEPTSTLDVKLPPWEERLKRVSRTFGEHPEILDSAVRFEATAENRYFVNTEGSSVQTARTHARVAVSAATIADDGMNLSRTEILDASRADALPDEAAIHSAAKKVIEDLVALRKARPIEPYAGPAILNGRAAGVFFHEIFGHRIEGHRQKSEDEGQTFAHKVGQAIMPPFLDVYDDPTVTTLNGVELNGHYLYDDEGVLATRPALVDDGVLTGFLMSRSPTRGFDQSNGHGRRQRGHRVVARQGNLVVDPSETTTPDGLKQLLIQEVLRQKKPYGLRFTEITGGYTNTTRSDAQAFKVLPVMVYKVYPDGREELVRGVDVEGTPLTVLSKILAAANDFEVFNGTCGAESGWVPVSAASPSLLVSQIEVARREKEQDRPPLLPPPPMDPAAGPSPARSIRP